MTVESLLKRIRLLRSQKKLLRETLTQVKVDHLNKKTKLPLETHAMLENALRVTEKDDAKP